MNPEKEKIRTLLKGVIDPELMVNIVDLGLVYHITMDEDKMRIIIDMTLTSPGCPLGEVITNSARELIVENYPGHSVEINLVWEPAWSHDRLTAEGRAALGGY